MDTQRLKKCPMCQTWFSLDDILENPEIVPIGMMFEPNHPEASFYYFNHMRSDCGSTFVVPVETVASLINESIPPDYLSGSDQCSNHCTQLDDLNVCQVECHHAPFRRFLQQLIKNRRQLTVLT